MSKPLNPWKLSGYKAGQNVICQVTNPEPGGYGVTIPKDNLPGFLPTKIRLQLGEEVLAQFVCVHNNRILLSTRLSNTSVSSSCSQPQAVRWEEQLNETSTVSLKEASDNEAEAAFGVWASCQTNSFSLKRATDLIMPPLEQDSVSLFKIADHGLEWLITDLEGGMRTACVKASSQERLSRSAMLLYRGRTVGCIYGCKTMPDTQPTEQSLQLMLSDLELPETKVQIYDLPESIILAISALFLGYPVEHSDNHNAYAYFDYTLSWLESKGQTACFAITLPSNGATCLSYIHQGNFCGAFYVEEQKFIKEKTFVLDLLNKEPNAKIEVSVLPPEMTSSAIRFGFSVSMARQRHT